MPTKETTEAQMINHINEQHLYFRGGYLRYALTSGCKTCNLLGKATQKAIEVAEEALSEPTPPQAAPPAAPQK